MAIDAATRNTSINGKATAADWHSLVIWYRAMWVVRYGIIE